MVIVKQYRNNDVYLGNIFVLTCMLHRMLFGKFEMACILGLGLWSLTLLSIIFQLYRGGQF